MFDNNIIILFYYIYYFIYFKPRFLFAVQPVQLKKTQTPNKRRSNEIYMNLSPPISKYQCCLFHSADEVHLVSYFPYRADTHVPNPHCYQGNISQKLVFHRKKETRISLSFLNAHCAHSVIVQEFNIFAYSSPRCVLRIIGNVTNSVTEFQCLKISSIDLDDRIHRAISFSHLVIISLPYALL